MQFFSDHAQCKEKLTFVYKGQVNFRYIRCIHNIYCDNIIGYLKIKFLSLTSYANDYLMFSHSILTPQLKYSFL